MQQHNGQSSHAARTGHQLQEYDYISARTRRERPSPRVHRTCTTIGIDNEDGKGVVTRRCLALLCGQVVVGWDGDTK